MRRARAGYLFPHLSLAVFLFSSLSLPNSLNLSPALSLSLSLALALPAKAGGRRARVGASPGHKPAWGRDSVVVCII